MVSSPSIRPSVVRASADRGLFIGLVDDAGLFPPEELPMPAAAARHRRDVVVASPVLSHRFVLPGNRLDELRGALSGEDLFEVSVITALEPSEIRAIVSAVQADPRLSLVGVEGVLPSEWTNDGDRVIAALDNLPPGTPAFVEVPGQGDVESAVAFVAAHNWSVKLRCGGVRRDLFPTADQLATAIRACTAAGVAFKATAGLHHAVRYRDPSTGFVHHGFLNILIAVARAVAGQDLSMIADALNSTDPAALVAETVKLDAGTAALARAAFVSYGSCSTADPINDLLDLGLLTESATT